MFEAPSYMPSAVARRSDAAPPFAPLAAIDFRSIALNHYDATGVDVPLFDDRLRVYELHIGLTHLAYCAFARRASDLFAVARRLASTTGPLTH